MASVNSPIRRFLKPLLFRLLGRRGYFHLQVFGKARDIRKRLVEEKEMALLPRLVSEGDIVLDIGANFAYYAVRLSGLVGDSGTVVAFEPIPFTHDVCAALLKKFDAGNVELHRKGVGARDEILEFSVPLQDFGAMSAGQAHLAGRDNDREGREKYYTFSSATTFECPVVALDGFLPDYDRPVTFVKIDIEGAELWALQGMEGLLRKHRPVVLVEIQPFFLQGFGITEQEILDEVDRLDYELYLYEPEAGGLRRFTGDLVDSNYLMLPGERSAEFSDIIL